MKRLFFFFTLALCWLGIQAQGVVTVSGVLSDVSGPLSGQTVTLISPNNQPSFQTVTTNPNGFYTANIQTTALGGSAVVFATCGNGSIAADSVFFPPVQTNITLNLYCGPVVQLCHSEFDWQAVGGTTIVNFSNLSFSGSGLPLTYHWDFGDGNIATTSNPSHTYSQPGIYSACLTVSDAQGCSDTYCLYVTAGGATFCDADFQYFSSSPGTVLFVPLAIQFPVNFSYSWSFGDGNTSTDPAPIHPYTSAGTYTVCLALSDPQTACVDSFCTQVVVQSASGCSAYYYAYPTGNNSVQFLTDTSTYSPNLSYVWDFGDGNFGTGPNPAHTYAQSGLYLACLTVSDSATGCYDNFCNHVSVGSNCFASFSATPLAGNDMQFVADTFLVSSTATFTWDFGDGGTGAGLTATHSYAAPGLYTVCLTVSDSLSGCVNSTCYTIHVGPAPIVCSAHFYAYAAFPGLGVQFIPDSALLSSQAVYTWDFGDGIVSSFFGNVPYYVYANPGTYYVCLTITDTAGGCFDTWCDSVTVGGSFPGNSISGLVHTDSLSLFEGYVYLIQHDSLAGTLTVVDSVYSQTGYYIFFGVDPGTYLVKAALLPNSSTYADFLPTYFGDELFWNNATSIVMTSTDLFLPPINLIPGINPGGPGFIGGLISQGANKDEGDPMGNVSVIVTHHSSGAGASYTYSHNDGSYSISNLNYGTYYVQVEMPGRYSIPTTVVIAPGQENHSDLNFEVSSTSAYAVTGIDELASGRISSLYPNPTRDFAELVMEMERSDDLNVRISNLTGQTLFENQVSVGAGEQRISLDLSQLPQGMYLLDVRGSNGRLTARIVKGL
ncbi:MAG: PKD domain-containing protein [Bacteroidetes bacterium]|nr:MAG: PKD domain-containing protein [Bacteroidota bacterium]